MARDTAHSTEELQLEALIGTGSVGEVWRARLPDGTPVALKRMLPHAARNEASVLAFEREARLYGRFDTPGIPHCLGHGRDEQGPYLLLEYVEGTTLSALLGAPIDTSLALRVTRDVLAVLETVHSLADDDGKRLGLVHRDLSPMNVLIGSDGTIKLGDFGIARSTVGTHATTGVMAKGTLGYMSPEQARGLPLDARSDLFAVGALLHEMLTGSPPYDEQDPRLALARARAGDIAPMSETMPDADPSLGDLVDQALAAESVERFSSAEHMRREVERVAARLGMASDEQIAAWARSQTRSEQPAESVPHSGPRVRKEKSSQRWAVVAAVLALILGLFVFWPSSHPDPSPAAVPSASATAETSAGAPQQARSVAPPTTSAPAVRASALPRASGPPPASTSTSAEPAVLDIGSSPSFAYVTIDGRSVGATPLFGVRLAPGKHTIRVERQGLGARTITIDLRPGQRARKVISLP